MVFQEIANLSYELLRSARSNRVPSATYRLITYPMKELLRLVVSQKQKWVQVLYNNKGM